MQSSILAVDSDENAEKKPLNKLLISAGLLSVAFPFAIDEGYELHDLSDLTLICDEY